MMHIKAVLTANNSDLCLNRSALCLLAAVNLRVPDCLSMACPTSSLPAGLPTDANLRAESVSALSC